MRPRNLDELEAELRHADNLRRMKMYGDIAELKHAAQQVLEHVSIEGDRVEVTLGRTKYVGGNEDGYPLLLALLKLSRVLEGM